MQLDSPDSRHRENPYATPSEAPVRNYWSRFGTAIVKAWKFYRRQMRRDGITLGEEFRAWCSLLILTGILTFLLVALGFALVQMAAYLGS